MNAAVPKLSLILVSCLLAITSHAVTAGGSTTTTYVGRHFEIRDYDEPVKYVFNGATRIARITGSVNSTQRIQRFHLYAGWNLLSLAISVTDPLYQITNALPSAMGSILLWDKPASAWAPLAAGTALSVGSILWVQCASPACLALNGTYSEPANQSLDPNGSFLPGAGLQAWELGPALSNAAPQSVWTYDGFSGLWFNWLTAPIGWAGQVLPVIPPGSAVFVRATAPALVEAPPPASRIRYYHPDHLGSSSVLTDGDGQVIEEVAYYPFAGTRQSAPGPEAIDPYGFGQKERDRESGLHYFEARYLGSILARFASVDPKFANPELLGESSLSAFTAQPQKGNLYAYAENNPLTLFDPDGLESSRSSYENPFGDAGRALAEKAEQIGRGARKVVHKVDEGIDAIGEGVDRATKVFTEGVHRVTEAIDEGVQRGVHAVDTGVRTAVHVIGKGIRSALRPVHYWDKPEESVAVVNWDEVEEPEVHYRVTAHDDPPPPPVGPRPIIIRPHPRPPPPRQASPMSADECWTGIHRLRP